MWQRMQKVYLFRRFTLSVAGTRLSCSGPEFNLEPEALDLIVYFLQPIGELVNLTATSLIVRGTGLYNPHDDCPACLFAECLDLSFLPTPPAERTTRMPPRSHTKFGSGAADVLTPLLSATSMI